jgi:phosphate transport system permease protein
MSDSAYSPHSTRSLLPGVEAREKLRRSRALKDKLSRYGVATSGLAVIGALLLIFVYLFSEVFPLLRPAALEPTESQFVAPTISDTNPAMHLVLERYEEIGSVYSQQGLVVFFNVSDGSERASFQVPIPEGAQVSGLGYGELIGGITAYGFSNGQALLLKQAYELTYPNDVRLVTPVLEYPLGEQPVVLDEQGQSLVKLAVQHSAMGYVVAAATADNRLLLGVLESASNLFTGEMTVDSRIYPLPAIPGNVTIAHLVVDKTVQNVVAADTQGRLYLIDIRKPDQARLVGTYESGAGAITAMDFLVGTSSIVVGTEKGEISQWLLVRNASDVFQMHQVRSFEPLPGRVQSITPEYNRKGFIAVDDQGYLGIYFGTSAKTLLIEQVSDSRLQKAAVSPINGKLLTLDVNQKINVIPVWNGHPEISFSALWEKVWYEGREQPEYIWQASSGQDDFEAKMSLIPLTLGTLKAAVFAMLFAMPLGIMGAIYTAYFMTPRMRGFVKPTIEIMEALPTVILGFLAGLWLAPFMENNLPAVFSILIGMPLIMLLTAFAWSFLPANIRNQVPEGSEAVVLVVPILLMGWLCVSMSPVIETLFFDGSMRQWFTNVGVTYDQRNAMVVGVAMGFAVIPTIFSIAEDAVFNVPRHLTQGSLALGATRWQTVVGVVLPTASPGIFSAVMMGFGRAVGETMIVLMATGNSPVVNFNIFEGMRTLSANIAVELPETAVESSHFRVLFLAALVLLILTFVVNTLAEIIRQRLRARYSNL